jgi:peroxiredoxin
LESDWDEFDRRELKVVCVAAQKINSFMRARQFVKKHTYRFPILFDETRKITKAFGVYHLLGLDAYRIARPAAFLLDEEQKIQWIAVSPNQTQLPTSAEMLEAIAAAGKY